MAAIDQDKCGVVAVTAEGRPVVMNGAAADLLSQAKVVQLAHGIVRPTHYSDAIRFHAALDSVTRRGAGFRLRRDAMIMLLNGYGRASSLVVSIAPLPVRARGTADEDPIAIIHLFRPVLSVEGLGAVCRLVGLSPTDAKLAGHLYRGHTIAEAASAMRIKIETARSYLKQIFAKTDTHRQADLLALLYQYSSVVRGNHDYSVI
jgi:DNA-binding CsgD family transcriptional regulator